MKVNAVICLIKGERNIDQARGELNSLKSDEDLKNDTICLSMLKQIEIYLLIQEKKYEEAIKTVKAGGVANVQDALLLAQLNIFMKN